jgi:hypothetical protein
MSRILENSASYWVPDGRGGFKVKIKTAEEIAGLEIRWREKGRRRLNMESEKGTDLLKERVVGELVSD